ncbi:MAG: hypothetical protein H0T90_03100 [Gemmatimonadales bacterium]|nr:hypothetical protein [Gemmatimonadales bacterium]
MVRPAAACSCLGELRTVPDFDEDLVGTWTLSGNTVHLEHEADTFLRDVPLTLQGELLSGEYSTANVVVRAVLVRD